MERLFLSVVLWTCFSLSLETQSATTNCVVGDNNQNHLVNQLANAHTKSDITQNIFKKYGLNNASPAKQETTQSGICSDCDSHVNPLSSHNHGMLKSITGAVNKSAPLAFKNSCVQAAVQLKTDTSELLCPQNQTDGRSNNHNLCVSQKMLDYQNAVVSDFHSCVASLTDSPITLEGLFEMYSLESTFKPHYAYDGGVGLGQLTSIFVKDVQQRGRGLTLLGDIAKSDKPQCDIAKQIASDDIKSPKSLYPNRCNYVQYGEGMERNVLYTLVGLATWWDKNIGKMFNNYKKKHQGNPMLSKVMEMSLLNAYGSGGISVGRAAIRRLLDKGLSPTNFLAQLETPMRGKKGSNLTKYTSNISKKQNDLLEHLPENERRDFKQQGARLCLNK